MTTIVSGKGNVDTASWDQLKELVSDVLKSSMRNGVTAVEVGAGIDSGLSTSVRKGEVETIEFNRDKSLGLTIYKGKSKGSVSTTDISRDAIESAIEAACRIAGHTEDDEYAGLADKEFMAKDIPDLELFHPSTLTPEQSVDYAKNCEQAALGYDDRISNSEGASFSTFERFRVYGNSHGFLGAYPSTRYSLSCSVIGKEPGNDAMQRDYDYTIARDLSALLPAQQVGEKAAEKTIARLGSRKIKTCQSPVIFAPSVATSLWGCLVSAISGGNLYRKSSFLLDQLNKKIFPEFISVKESPHLLQGLGSAPFDSEGVATSEREIISEGILSSYVLSSYSARRLGMVTTGNAGGVHNLSMTHSDKDLNTLIKEMNKGLVVTELMGHGINIVTGDYSRGAAGFWVENGEIQFPVSEITVAGNLKDMFQNIKAVGNDLDHRSNIITGSVLISEMTIAGD